MIIRIVQSKGRKDRHVMLPPELLVSLRQWWKLRPTRFDAGMPLAIPWPPPRSASYLPSAEPPLSRVGSGRGDHEAS